MANPRLISRFIDLSSVLRGALVALRARPAALPHPRVDGLRSQGRQPLRGSRNVERAEGPAWPPAEGVYWGM